jgi:hypothetical protein
MERTKKEKEPIGPIRPAYDPEKLEKTPNPGKSQLPRDFVLPVRNTHVRRVKTETEGE